MFTLTDYISNIERLRRLGPMDEVMNSIPGMREAAARGNFTGADVERVMDRMEAIYLSMTLKERLAPELLKDAKRQRRIAVGAGVEPSQMIEFLDQFKQFQIMMGRIKRT